VIDASRIQLHHCVPGICGRRVDDVGGAAAACDLELRRVTVDRDQRPGARERRSGDHLETDPAASDHRHAFPRIHVADVANGSEARHHAAAEQGRLPQRQSGR